ncbi:hypothetical protein OJ998_07660 [Solirubrobacter taibaiensis]|nr:hypothetical protein [Solirubrobacter taibaiensis]
MTYTFAPSGETAMSFGVPASDVTVEHGGAAALLKQPVASRPPGTTAEAALAPTSVNTTTAKTAAIALRVLLKPRIGASLTLPFASLGRKS